MMDNLFHLILPGDRIRAKQQPLRLLSLTRDPYLAKECLEFEKQFRTDPEFRRQHAEHLAMQQAAA